MGEHKPLFAWETVSHTYCTTPAKSKWKKSGSQIEKWGQIIEKEGKRPSHLWVFRKENFISGIPDQIYLFLKFSLSIIIGLCPNFRFCPPNKLPVTNFGGGSCPPSPPPARTSMYTKRMRHGGWRIHTTKTFRRGVMGSASIVAAGP